MGVFGKAEILRHLQNGSIRIEPYDRESVGPNGYDFHIGQYYCQEMPRARSSILCPWDAGDSSCLWEEPKNAMVDGSSGYIIVQPGQTVLAHSEEFVYTAEGLLVTIRCRSSIARTGLSIVKCAGMGDDGYGGRWTVEISNHRRYGAVAIPVGARIGQLVFEEVKGLTHSENQYHGKYGKRPEDWTPYDMLPKLYLDREVSQYAGVSVSKAFAQMRLVRQHPTSGA